MVPPSFDRNCPDYRAEQKYILQPVFFAEGVTGAFGIVGYLDENYLSAPNSGMTAEDVLGVGQQDSGTSSGANDATHFNDTTKSWGINAWAGKVLVITAGTGAGQTRVIASNSATQIVINTAFTTVAVLVSGFSLFAWNAGLFCRRWPKAPPAAQVRYLKRPAPLIALGCGTGISALFLQGSSDRLNSFRVDLHYLFYKVFGSI